MLTKTAKEVLKKNQTAIGRIADAIGRSVYTVRDWLYDDSEKGDIMLTTATAMQIIREETGLSDAEILTPSTSAA